MPRQTCSHDKQAMTPENRYTYTIFIESDLICSHQGKLGWVQNAFSFLGMALQVLLHHNSCLVILQRSVAEKF